MFLKIFNMIFTVEHSLAQELLKYALGILMFQIFMINLECNKYEFYVLFI